MMKDSFAPKQKFDRLISQLGKKTILKLYNWLQLEIDGNDTLQHQFFDAILKYALYIKAGKSKEEAEESKACWEKLWTSESFSDYKAFHDEKRKHKQWDEKARKADIWSCLPSEKSFEENRFHKEQSKLTQKVEDFIMFEESRKKPEARQLILLEYYFQNNMESRVSWVEVQRLEEAVHKIPQRDETYYWYQMKMIAFKAQWQLLYNLAEAMDSMRQLHHAEETYLALQYVRRAFFKPENIQEKTQLYAPKAESYVIRKLEKNPYLQETPVLQLYLAFYRLRKRGRNVTKEQVLEVLAQFRTHYKYLIDYNVTNLYRVLVNTSYYLNDHEFYLTMILEGLEENQQWARIAGEVPTHDYLNFILSAINCKKSRQEIHELIHTYGINNLNSGKTASDLLNLAELYIDFNEKNYWKVVVARNITFEGIPLFQYNFTLLQLKATYIQYIQEPKPTRNDTRVSYIIRTSTNILQEFKETTQINTQNYLSKFSLKEEYECLKKLCQATRKTADLEQLQSEWKKRELPLFQWYLEQIEYLLAKR